MKNIQFSNKRKYFYDCEFMEQPGYLKLVSLGVVGEHVGQEFYACNLDAREDFRTANSWVKNNVLPRLPDLGHSAWMTEKEIRDRLSLFLDYSKSRPVELWSYFADHDHVLLCWLFGRLVDLPEGVPQCTFDIRQLIYHMDIDLQRLPQQKGSAHHALDDAKYHKEMFDYLVNAVRFDL